VAGAFALGAVWPFSARLGATWAEPVPVAAPVATPVPGLGSPPGTHEVTAACRSVGGSLPSNAVGALDTLRSDTPTSVVVPTGGTIDRTTQYLIQGWAAAAGGTRPALGVCLIVDGRVQPKARAFYGASRPDVAEALHHDGALMTGYDIVIPVRLLTPGHHRIEVAVQSAAGEFAVLPVNREVTVQ
jgi:hypothetical protein